MQFEVISPRLAKIARECWLSYVWPSTEILTALLSYQYLSSYEYFIKRETLLNRKLILPILYIDTPKLNDKNDNVAVELSKRQWIDWQDLRFASLTSKKVSKKMESLAKNIRKLIDEKVFEDVNKNFESEYLLPEAKLRKTVDVETKPGLGVQAVEKITQQTTSLQSLYAPISHANHHSDPPKSITILIQPTDDWERNKRRIKILHSTLISFYGRDKFSFQFFVDGKGHLIDFPNDTTRVCPELLERLKKLLGEESWRIDEIKFVEQEG